MSDKAENFSINLNIIEGRHLAWPNMNSAVHVRVDTQKKCTAIRQHTDSPFYNEYFSFDFTTTLPTLLDRNITLTVLRPRTTWKRRKTLGYVTLDVATVWEQPDHQFYHKWAILTAPIGDTSSGPRGYLKVDMYVLRKGESSKIPAFETQDTDEIEGNLLLPEGLTLERQRANYVFNIYQGKKLLNPKPLGETNLVRSPNCYVEVRFAGLKGKTSTQKNSSNPIWNERLVLTELFPPLCQRITIHLHHKEACHDTILASRSLNFRSISNDGEHGFLPTFGPTFVHFYGNNNGLDVFVGEVLISFQTELQIDTIGVARTAKSEPIEGLNEINLWRSEPVLLCGIICSANFIDKRFRDKSVSFEINFGNILEDQKQKDEEETPVVCNNITAPSPTLTKSKLYWHLEYGENKPFLFIQAKYPDFRKRLYNSNVISKIAEDLKFRLDSVEAIFESGEYKNEDVEKLLYDAIDFLSCACRKYIDMTSPKNGNFQTDLDREHKNFCIREMGDIENALKTIHCPKMNKKCFCKLHKLHQKLELLVEDAQDCWPDVFVSMLVDNKKVGFLRIPAKDLVYSTIEDEKGKYCGKVQHLFLQSLPLPKHCCSPPEPDVTCKLEILLWMGLKRHKAECFASFPSGVSIPDDLPSQNNTPSYLTGQEKHSFQCRAHIYQGKFFPGLDKSGLSDPFVRIIIEGECKQTAVISATLSPVWDQTLFFTSLILYGSKSHIKENPPIVVAEVFDKDECWKVEFMGRCTLVPALKFSDEPYKEPNFPPKLKWHKVYNKKEVSGEILAVVEFLELSSQNEDLEVKPSNDIVKIPPDIKPNLVKYRIEVIFWGVRELKRIHLLPITKPKVVLECGHVFLHSNTIKNASKTLNFTEPNKFIEVDLPDQKEYFPPLCLKIFDCRSFGRYTLAGTYIGCVSHFLFHPLTAGERKKKLEELEMNLLMSAKLKAVTFKKDEEKFVKKESKVQIVEKPQVTAETTEIWYKSWLKSICGPKKKRVTRMKKQRKISSKTSSETEPLVSMEPSPEKQKKPKKATKKTKKGESTTSSESTPSKNEKNQTPKVKSDKKKTKKKDKKSPEGTTTSSDTTSSSKKKTKKKTKEKKQKPSKTNNSSSSSSSKSSKKSNKISKDKKKKVDEQPKKKKKSKRDKSTTTTSSTTSSEAAETKQLLKKNRPKKERKRKAGKKSKETKGKEKYLSKEIDYDWWTKYFASTEDENQKREGSNEQRCEEDTEQKGDGDKKRKSDGDSKEKSNGDKKQKNFGGKKQKSDDDKKEKGDGDKNPELEKRRCSLKIYLNELEAQPEFNNFIDYLHTFPMYRGKRTGDEAIDEENITGIFKGAIRIHRIPEAPELQYVTETGYPLSEGAFQNFPPNEPVTFALRIYCVKGTGLKPKDPNGKSDPYIVVTMGHKVINDKANHLSCQVNPTFGRCFELVGSFPRDHAVTVAIWDWDLTSSDDLIGETRIDIENRFYTRHRAHCGISSVYEESGHCYWRDQEKPTKILEMLCKKNNLELPVYSENSIRVANRDFPLIDIKDQTLLNGSRKTTNKESLALVALKQWHEVPLVGHHLVPEHVETRSLYHPAKPGIEQGKLQMWIDIFPCVDLPPPKKVDITPRKPVAYELRVIIWNTEDVILDEDGFLGGEKMSDIYVKGWLTGPETSQYTDVHYRSMTGEGSFNWRFIFHFKYLSTENKLVMTRKESLFSVEETDFKMPCRLTLQVWDNDVFSADDFLGIVVLEFARLPRGAKSANTCTLKVTESRAPKINLFKVRRTRGWWPFHGIDKESRSAILAGKVELEFELLTEEEAEKDPVGLGRSDPKALPKPARPDTSFSWFKNPLKAFHFMICKQYKWKMIKCALCLLLLVGIVATVFSFPEYTMKKFLGV